MLVNKRVTNTKSTFEDKHRQNKISLHTEEYREKFANPFVAGSLGFIDDVIDPKATRAHLSSDLSMLRSKSLDNPWKKHDNIPL